MGMCVFSLDEICYLPTCFARRGITYVLYNKKYKLAFKQIMFQYFFQGAFYLYTGIALVGFFLFLGILPETKGKSLEEMEILFSKPGTLFLERLVHLTKSR